MQNSSNVTFVCDDDHSPQPHPGHWPRKEKKVMPRETNLFFISPLSNLAICPTVLFFPVVLRTVAIWVRMDMIIEDRIGDT